MIKPKQCKECGKSFTPKYSTLENACSPECNVELQNKKPTVRNSRTVRTKVYKPTIKTCKICKSKFTPKNVIAESFCQEYKCKVAYAMMVVEKQKSSNEKKKRQNNLAEKKVLRDKLKTKSEYESDLQKEVNTIVRLIDKGCVCISSRNTLNDKFDAGHLYSVGSNPTLRFNLFNIYAQSVYANQHLSGDQLNFLTGLEEFYGSNHKEYVLSLKSEYKLIKLTVDELKEKTITARQIVKYLKLEDKSYSCKERLELRKEYNDMLGIYAKILNF